MTGWPLRSSVVAPYESPGRCAVGYPWDRLRILASGMFHRSRSARMGSCEI